MKIGQAENWLRNELNPVYGEGEANSMTAIVLEELTGLSRTERLNKADEPLNVHQLHHLTEIHHRLLNHEPLQYIFSKAWFMGMELFVNKEVLIPRPETEELVQWILDDIKIKFPSLSRQRTGEADETSILKIMDIGTGSGCIALALKKFLPKAEVWGCDTSDEALNVARRNGSDLDIRVDFQGINFLDEEQQRFLPSVDIIVSNPPYIEKAESVNMPQNVVHHEPHRALFTEEGQPLQFYIAIAAFAEHRLHKGGMIYLEIHEERGDEIVQLFKDAGYKNIILRQDMQGKNRMMRIEKN